MVDIVDRKTRSRMMSGIRGRDTQPEMLIRKSLHSLGFRYRVHASELPGCPDLVFPKYRAVLFVHGCFWHRHCGCRLTTTPSSNIAFWDQKFRRTAERDEEVLAKLKKLGWRIGIIWECSLKKSELPSISKQLASWLPSKKLWLEIPKTL